MEISKTIIQNLSDYTSFYPKRIVGLMFYFFANMVVDVPQISFLLAFLTSIVCSVVATYIHSRLKFLSLCR